MTVVKRSAAADPDALYADLVALTAGMEPGEALVRQAWLILLLVNEIGDFNVVERLVRDASVEEL